MSSWALHPVRQRQMVNPCCRKLPQEVEAALRGSEDVDHRICVLSPLEMAIEALLMYQ